MLVSTEQEVSVTSPPELSASTPTVSDNRLGIDVDAVAKVGDWMDSLADPETTAATQKALAPYLPEDTVFIQNEKENDE